MGFGGKIAGKIAGAALSKAATKAAEHYISSKNVDGKAFLNKASSVKVSDLQNFDMNALDKKAGNLISNPKEDKHEGDD